MHTYTLDSTQTLSPLDIIDTNFSDPQNLFVQPSDFNTNGIGH